MKRTARRLLGLALALLIPLSAATPASAVAGSGYRWISGGCVDFTPPTGTIKQPRPYNPLTGTISLELRTQTCRPVVNGEVLGIAFYFADQTSTTFLLHYPAGLGATGYGPVPASSVAVCMVSSDNRRMDCAAVVWQNGVPSAYTRIPVTSPQVSYPVTPNWEVIGGHPNCTECWP